MRPDLYFSADVEADGPIPGDYSMLSFGLAVAGRYDGVTYTAYNPEEAGFYRELRPISEQVSVAEAQACKLDRARLMVEGTDPRSAMLEAAEWVFKQAGIARPVMVGYPLGYDWMFLQWYFAKYSGGAPFGYSEALDCKTMYQVKSGVTVGKAGRNALPDFLRGTRKHTHNALNDAIEQAEIFSRLFVWDGQGPVQLDSEDRSCPECGWDPNHPDARPCVFE